MGIEKDLPTRWSVDPNVSASRLMTSDRGCNRCSIVSTPSLWSTLFQHRCGPRSKGIRKADAVEALAYWSSTAL